MELSIPKTRKFLIFSQKKAFLYFRKQNFFAQSLQNIYTSGRSLQNLKNKNFLYFFKNVLPNFGMTADQFD